MTRGKDGEIVIVIYEWFSCAFQIPHSSVIDKVLTESIDVCQLLGKTGEELISKRLTITPNDDPVLCAFK